MLNALIRVRIEQLKSWLHGPQTKKKVSKGAVIGFTLLMLYSLCAIGLFFWHNFSMMAEPFHMLGLDWLYFSMAALSCFALMFVGTVFFAKAQLYEAKDNELLLSMPIKPGDILISRLVMLLIVAVIFALPVMVPAIVVWCSVAGAGSITIAFYVLEFLLLPLFALSLSALFGWLLSLLTARIRRKALFGTVLCVALLAGYSYLMFKLNTSLQDFAINAGSFAGSLGAIAPAYWLGAAISEGRADYLLYVALISLGSAAIAYTVLSRTFIKIATAKHGFSRIEYVEREAKFDSPDKALLRREFARFSSSSAYMVNCGLGLIMEVAAAVFLLIKRKAALALLAQAPELASVLPAALVLGLCLFTSMDYVSAPSVSLEGKNLWLVKSLPVHPFRVLAAKLKMHLIVCLPPALLLSVVTVIVFRPSAFYSVFIVLMPVLFCLFVGLLGLTEDLRHPKLDWTNEAQAVKSGFGLLFTMLISWGVLAVPALIAFVLELSVRFELIVVLFFAFVCVACLALYQWLRRRGAEKFALL